MRNCLGIHLAVTSIMLQPTLIMAQRPKSFQPAGTVNASSLTDLFSAPIIESYDLSPDGKTVALLVVAGTKVGAHFQLVTEELTTKKVTASSEMGTSVFPMSGFAPQVVYSSDGQYLIVQDLRSIRVVESSSLRLVRTIAPSAGKETQSPVFAIGARNRNIFACAFGAEQKFDPRIHTVPVWVEVVDISSGESLGSWAAEDVPQSLSPDGDLVAVSSSQPQQGVLPLNVFDVHGHKQATLTGGFQFSGADKSKMLGRVVGLFTGERGLLLAPDDNIDLQGHHSGDRLQLATLTAHGGEIQKSIRPRHYGPTGELAVSADGNTALAVSWYVPAHLLAQDGPLPASTPEVLVVEIGANAYVEAALPIQPLAFGVSGWMENRRPRVSADGSVVAVAQDNGVAVFTRSPSPK